ncbi:MAG TPA: hypothetical protein VNT79_03000, partial [Phycisphaerae bacterium]|nr:hypothetical protein [Phycisphaerae bacterium]
MSKEWAIKIILVLAGYTGLSDLLHGQHQNLEGASVGSSTTGDEAQSGQLGPAPRIGGSSPGPAPEPGEPRSPSDRAWGIEEVATASPLVNFALNAPGTFNTVGNSNLIQFTNAYDFAGNDFSRIYVLTFSNDRFYRIDTGTGTATQISTATPQSGDWLSMSWNPINATMYAIAGGVSQTHLYTITLDTGVPTLIAALSPISDNIGLAISSSGDAFGYGVQTDTFYSIDLATGTTTSIGPIGFDASFGQGMDFDDSTGELYMAAVSSIPLVSDLRLVNISTGATTVVGNFPANTHLGSLTIEAEVPKSITYQGRLLQNGEAVEGPADFIFTLYEVEAGGSAVGNPWPADALVVSEGLFTAAPSFPGVNFGQELWLEIQVAYPVGGTYVALAPRQLLTPAPRAHFADMCGDLVEGSMVSWTSLTGVPAGFADGVDDVGPGDGHSLDASDGSPADAVFVDAAGNIGVWTTTPAQKLDMRLGSLGLDNEFAVRWRDSLNANFVSSIHGTKDSLVLSTASTERMRISPTGQVGIGTNSSAKLGVYDGGESAIQTDFMQGLTSAGLNIITDYTASTYTPGIFWSTQNNSSTRPKAGIYSFLSGAGSKL